MVSEFMRKKYEHHFHSFFDIDKNGYIDANDFKLTASRLCKLRGYKPGQKEYDYVENYLLTILKSILDEFDENKDGRVSIEEWMNLYDKYAKNPSISPEWQKLHENFAYEFFSLQSPVIKKKDYVDTLVEFGFSKHSAESAFDKMSKGKPTINEAEFRQMWREYFTSDDPDAVGNFAFGAEINI